MQMDAETTFRQIEFGSPAYRSELRLRDAVLRRPLGLRLMDEDLSCESADYHFGAFAGEKLIGTLMMTPVDKSAVHMRQVAVAEECRGAGVGRTLVAFAEGFVRSRGYSRVDLHARKTAVPFYLKLGYQKTGSAFVEVTVPHEGMVKVLGHTGEAI